MSSPDLRVALAEASLRDAATMVVGQWYLRGSYEDFESALLELEAALLAPVVPSFNDLEGSDDTIDLVAAQPGLKGAAQAVADWLGPCDHFDHHGNCQTHAVERPCRVATLRALLDQPASKPDDAGGIDVDLWHRAQERVIATTSYGTNQVYAISDAVAAEYARLTDPEDRE